MTNAKKRSRIPTLYAAKGGGSLIVEAAYALAGRPLGLVDVPWNDTGWSSKALAQLNPLGQVPTLVLPDGTIMTESAAIVLALHDQVPDAGLAPPVRSKDRGRFLRWLMVFNAAIYPTFTYGDVPERWVGGKPRSASAKALRQATDRHREILWRHVEPEAREPWFLGRRFSALDLYLWPMTQWRPGPEWFQRECPRLYAIGERVRGLPALQGVAQRQEG